MEMFFFAQEFGGQQPPMAFLIGFAAVMLLVIASMWVLFTKAGKPGWAILVPIYNIIVLLDIVGRPVWWLFLFLIPLVNFIVSILIAIDFAKAYGKETGFGLGLAFLPFIFYPILAFGDNQYEGPATF